jgi:hypothetical protein
MKLAILALIVLPSVALSSPKCEEVDALATLASEQKTEVALTLGAEWKHATYCDFGAYKVIAPTDQKSDAIMIIKGGHPFIFYQAGFGINLFQDIGNRKSAPYVTVQDWDYDGKFERLDYLVLDASGNVVGNARDKAMTGVIEVMRYKADEAKKK